MVASRGIVFSHISLRRDGVNSAFFMILMATGSE